MEPKESNTPSQKRGIKRTIDGLFSGDADNLLDESSSGCEGPSCSFGTSKRVGEKEVRSSDKDSPPCLKNPRIRDCEPTSSSSTDYFEESSSAIRDQQTSSSSNQLLKDPTKMITYITDANKEPAKRYKPGGYYRVTIGEIINSRYKIIRQLGWGTYATVWMAKDIQSDTNVSLKITKCSSFSERVSEKEVQYLKAVNYTESVHPGKEHIMKILDDFTLPGDKGRHTVIVCELLGPCVRLMMKKSNNRTFHLDVIRKICRQLLEGLHYLHMEAGIIHADLKTENIMIKISEEDVKNLEFNNWTTKMNGEDVPTTVYDLNVTDPNADIIVKIGDFGVAGWTTDKIYRTIQTCGLRAPEAFLYHNIGTKADLWSFACVAYELVTNTDLFDCHEEKDLLHHLRQISELLGEIPVDIYKNEDNENLISNYFDDNGVLKCQIMEKRVLVNDILIKCKTITKEEAEQFSDFLHLFLRYDPNDRSTAEEALKHPFLLPHLKN